MSRFPTWDSHGRKISYGGVTDSPGFALHHAASSPSGVKISYKKDSLRKLSNLKKATESRQLIFRPAAGTAAGPAAGPAAAAAPPIAAPANAAAGNTSTENRRRLELKNRYLVIHLAAAKAAANELPDGNPPAATSDDDDTHPIQDPVWVEKSRAFFKIGRYQRWLTEVEDEQKKLFGRATTSDVDTSSITSSMSQATLLEAKALWLRKEVIANPESAELREESEEAERELDAAMDDEEEVPHADG